MVTKKIRDGSLPEYWTNQQGGLQDFLRIAEAMTETVLAFHEEHGVHRRLSPEVFGCQIEDEAIRVTLLKFHTDSQVGSELAVSSWAYRAPEQSRRMCSDIDERTDLYTLGVIFFELLTGELPYHAAEPTEWIYAHLAKRPPHPSVMKPHIPHMLGNLIVKLLAKTPEMRYQSAYSLLYDIKKCRSTWEENGAIEAFLLGSKEFASQLRMPIVVSGRDHELSELTNAFVKTMDGKAEIVAVSGEPGSGKSTIVREWFRTQQQERGYFISGKSEQLLRDIPYAPLIHAFRELIHRFLSSSTEQLTRWKDKLIAALGDHASIITEIIPDMILLIGEQPAADMLPWTASRNRLHFAFQAMIRTIAVKRSPLVLFLDDVHWADAATLDFIHSITENEDLGYFLCIVAYREKEMPAGHWLCDQEAIPHRRIVLSSLTLAETEQYLCKMLQIEESRSLAEVIFQKTAGNPLFMKQLLQSLYDHKWLRFNTHEERWQWDAEQIRKQDALGDVRDLMMDHLQTLPDPTGKAISRAACIGHSFDLHTLAAICQDSIEDVMLHLEPALREGLVLPVRERESWQGRSQAIDAGSFAYSQPNVWFVFIHDTIQQVAYEAIPTTDQETIHVALGRYKWGQYSPDKPEEQLYTLLHHLMLGKNQLIDREEKLKVAELSLQASRKARKSAAYFSAVTFITFGTELLTDQEWVSRYPLTYEIFSERMQVEYACGHLDEGQRLFEQLIAHSGGSVDELRIQAIKLEIDINRGQAKAAFEEGLQLLERLGVKLPRKVGTARRKKELNQTRILLQGDMAGELHASQRQEASPHELAMLQLLPIVARASSFVDMNLFVVIICQSIRKMLNHHTANQFPEIISIFASFISSEEGWHKEGNELSEAALHLGEASFSPVKAKLSFIYALTHFWSMSTQETWPLFKEAHRISLASGDFYYAGFSLRGMMFSLFYGGQLSELREFCETQGGNLYKKDPFTQQSFRLYQQFTKCLQGETEGRLSMNDRSFEGEKFLEEMTPADIRIGLLFEYHICTIQLMYMFGQYESAVELWERTEHSERYYTYHSHLPEGLLYGYLAMSRLYSTLCEEQQAEAARKMRSMLAYMRKWSELGPRHFEHKYLLMQGEALRLKGKWEQALVCFDEAIASASESGYTHMEAMACELAGSLLLEMGKKKFAKTYLMDAYHGYQQWGAHEKCLQLHEQYADLLLVSQEHGRVWEQDLKLARESAKVEQVDVDDEQSLEVERDMFKKAAARLTQASGLEQLLGQYLVTLIENAGAAKGFWIVNKDGDWWIEAEHDVNRNVSRSGHSAPLESCFDLPISVVRFVARTQEPLILGDAHLDDLFAWDPYIRSVRPRSIICLPVQQLDRLAGIVYLENEAVTGAQASQRMELMQMLSAQLAVLNRFASEVADGKMEPVISDTGKSRMETSLLLQSLTEREKDVLRLMVKGLSNPEIAQRLELAVGTVKNITLVIYGKLQVNRRTQAVAKAKDWSI
ncbi:AAA family ATPase [Paenibacillus qinlingensis]|uniref:ATPase/DNA-binding CsgD family transcriptional regulator/GAF domain-containing protein n=1 Tax=Paenibacillus qinlingensis TaxID=1837343 RepID=A0ABU1P6H9_9BACL|nr:AAA family ATPase [Paenibacillus qinlingensis]MDR6555360.1 putative ATPase/DNA-binding CsgD family transcriptional regulator/GAF domain-containing protein [Paenibacillus qinlingensis]